MTSTPREAARLLTTAEVAARYRITTRTVRNWVRTGQLTPIRIGRTVRFRWADITENNTEMENLRQAKP